MDAHVGSLVEGGDVSSIFRKVVLRTYSVVGGINGPLIPLILHISTGYEPCVSAFP